jgi:hypothetical protein
MGCHDCRIRSGMRLLGQGGAVWQVKSPYTGIYKEMAMRMGETLRYGVPKGSPLGELAVGGGYAAG